MTFFLSRLAAFAVRNWLRLLIIGFALVLFSRKQVNFNVRLGGPAPVEAPATRELPAAEVAEAPRLLSQEHSAAPPEAAAPKAGFFERFQLFGGSDGPRYFEELSRVEEAKVAAFLRRFSNVAQAEQDKFGIPASVTLATALLFGKAGEQAAAREHNSFFGMPCGEDWRGPTARSGGRCVRTYETAWTAFRDFSLYLTSGKYTALQQFGNKDYRRWAAGLEELGYNDTDDLATQLLRTVDRFQLFRYD